VRSVLFRIAGGPMMPPKAASAVRMARVVTGGALLVDQGGDAELNLYGATIVPIVRSKPDAPQGVLFSLSASPLHD
jgi:hypothetical protein